jgi:hypothetical protein
MTCTRFPEVKWRMSQLMDDDIRWATQTVTVTICHNFVIGSQGETEN